MEESRRKAIEGAGFQFIDTEKFLENMESSGMPEGNPYAEKQFVIDSDEKLAWFARKIIMAKHEKEVLRDNYEARMSSIDNDIANLRAHFGPQVEEYITRKIISGDIKKGQKSISTLYGRVGLTAKAASVKIRSNGDFLAYMKEYHPDFIVENVTEVVNIDGIRYAQEMIPDENGEMIAVRGIPGTEFVPASSVVTVTQQAKRATIRDQDQDSDSGIPE